MIDVAAVIGVPVLGAHAGARPGRETALLRAVCAADPHEEDAEPGDADHGGDRYGGDGRLVAACAVTIGSEHDPLPIGEWKVKGGGTNPTFVYHPELFWDVDDSEAKQHLPPGPNSPVGVVGIDLDKEHYGIHSTPESRLIGRSESHGCVRLANWDAARLALMVSGRTGRVPVRDALATGPEECCKITTHGKACAFDKRLALLFRCSAASRAQHS